MQKFLTYTLNTVKLIFIGILFTACLQSKTTPGVNSSPSEHNVTPSSGNPTINDSSNDTLPGFTTTGNGQVVPTAGASIPLSSGFPIPATTTGILSFPKGIALDKNGNIYVADTEMQHVIEFDSKGNFLKSIGSFGEANGHFMNPDGVAFDTTGNLYVSSGNNIQVFDPSGNFKSAISINPGVQLVATNIKIDNSNNVMFIEDTFTGENIDVLNSSGQLIQTIEVPNSLENPPIDLAFDSFGNIFVILDDRTSISKYTNNDGKYTLSNTYPQNDTGLAIAFDSKNNYYSGNWGNILKYNSGDLTAPINTFKTNYEYPPNGIAIDKNGYIYTTYADPATIEVFDSTGNILSSFGTSINSQGILNNPKGINTDSSGNILVADTYNKRVQIFSSNGTFINLITSQASNPAPTQIAASVASDSSGNIYVADNDRIEKFTLSGQTYSFVSQIGLGRFASIDKILIDHQNNILVSDQSNNTILKFDTNGNFISQFGTAGTGNSQFNAPMGMALDSKGNLYVADSNNSRLQIFSPSGNSYQYLSEISGFDLNGVQTIVSPIAVSIDPSDNIYILDCMRGVFKYNSSGSPLLMFANSGGPNLGELTYPNDIAIDHSGNVYIADTQKSRIQKFDQNGNALTK